LEIHAARFNRLFSHRWDRVIDFLKLHYAVSQRDEPYWKDNREAASIPDRLADLLTLWRDQPPTPFDFPELNEVFPAASYQYVLYGMGFRPPPRGVMKDLAGDRPALVRQIQERVRALASVLPTNRDYLTALRSSAAPTAVAEKVPLQ